MIKASSGGKRRRAGHLIAHLPKKKRGGGDSSRLVVALLERRYPPPALRPATPSRVVKQWESIRLWKINPNVGWGETISGEGGINLCRKPRLAETGEEARSPFERVKKGGESAKDVVEVIRELFKRTTEREEDGGRVPTPSVEAEFHSTWKRMQT